MESLLTPVLAAAITTAFGILLAWITARSLQKQGLGDTQQQVNKSLRELADVEQAKREIVEADRANDKADWDSERAATAASLAAMTAERDRYRTMADDCDRRLNNAYSEMRTTGRLTDRRAGKRPTDADGGAT
jgi:hypothetical protein